jgi:hypothetical protein
MTYSSEGIPSHRLVGLVYLVDLVHLVSFVQPNKQDKPNKPNNSLLPLADFSASCQVSGERRTKGTTRS